MGTVHPLRPALFRCLGRYLAASAAITLVLAGVTTAEASITWQGGDWGGNELAPGNGDILSGTFTDVGLFVVGTGDTVYAGSSPVSVSANDVIVNGTLSGGTTLSPSLYLGSSTSLTLAGSLDQWTSVTLSAGTIAVSGDISLLPGSSITLIPSSGTGGGSPPSAGSITLSAGANTYVSAQDIVVGSGSVNISAGNVSISPGSGTIELEPAPLPSAALLFAPCLALVGAAHRWALRRRASF